jgi:hypothetical protein
LLHYLCLYIKADQDLENLKFGESLLNWGKEINWETFRSSV